MKVRIGTRGSDLALWQAHHVAERLSPAAETEIVVIKTRGDAIDDVPLQAVEGKAFFTAEIERALLDRDVDLAVHSHKDLATESPEGLAVIGVPARGPVAEVLLVRAESHDRDAPLLPLREGAKVGTSAPRRRDQLLALRPDLEVADLRGNVPTRVRRCQEGRYDAVVLAAAGIERLGLATDGLVKVALAVDRFVPAPAQGALAIQIRADDDALAEVCLAHLHDEQTAAVVRAERLLLERLGGGCHMPLGVLVERAAGSGDDAFRARAFLGAGCPDDDAGLRWAEASGATPTLAADAVHARLLAGEPTGAGPLAGLRVALVGSSADGTLLGRRLAELGATVLHEKVLAFEDVKAPDLPARLARLSQGDALVLTSQEAARRLAGHSVPPGVTIAAVGPATARALAAVGLNATHVGEGGATELARSLPVAPGCKVLFPCAAASRKDLPAVLEERGVPVDRVPLYRTVESADGEMVDDADVRVYMSPSAVASSLSLGREKDVEGLLRVGIGGTTCDALQDESLEHRRPAGSGPEPAVALLASIFGNRTSPTASTDR